MNMDQLMDLLTAKLYLASEARNHGTKAHFAKTERTRKLHQSGADMCRVILDELDRLTDENKSLREKYAANMVHKCMYCREDAVIRRVLPKYITNGLEIEDFPVLKCMECGKLAIAEEGLIMMEGVAHDVV